MGVMDERDFPWTQFKYVFRTDFIYYPNLALPPTILFPPTTPVSCAANFTTENMALIH